MNLDDLKKAINENASKSFLKLNPALGGLQERVAQPNPAPALVGREPGKKKGSGRVAVRVFIVSFRRRLYDSDSDVAAAKWLRDAISESLGIDDGHKAITFEYGQVRTIGDEGITVRIEVSQ